MHNKQRKVDRVSREKTVSMPLQSPVVRKGLTDQHRAQLYQQAMQRKTVSEIETSRLNRKETEEIPAFSKKSDTIFTLLQIGIGGVLMIVLIVVVPNIFMSIKSNVDAYRYGNHPMVHVEGTFGLAGETQCTNVLDPCKLTHVIAMNQEGSLVVIVVPPNDTQTKIYVMPGYTNFPLSDVPSIEKTTVQGSQAVRVQIDNVEWYLVVRQGQFTPAQL